ncbi:MAG: hypothetical protein ACK56I_34220, partial [bacterium]
MSIRDLVADVVMSNINVLISGMMKRIGSQQNGLQIVFPDNGRLVLHALQIREQLTKPGHFPHGLTDRHVLGLRTGQCNRRLALA